MKATASEFSRPYRLTQMKHEPLRVTIAAESDERAALARRFDLVALDRLEATVTLVAEGEAVVADGRMTAEVTQSCVATGEPLPVRLDEAVALRFVPEPESAPEAPEADDDIAESSADWDARDSVAYEGSVIDLGEAIAQTLLLSLDPYPRAEGADAFLKQKGVLSEEQAGPFAALAGLKDKLGRP